MIRNEKLQVLVFVPVLRIYMEMNVWSMWQNIPELW